MSDDKKKRGPQDRSNSMPKNESWSFSIPVGQYRDGFRFPNVTLGGESGLSVSLGPTPDQTLLDDPGVYLSGCVEAGSGEDAVRLVIDIALQFIGALTVDGWAGYSGAWPDSGGALHVSVASQGNEYEELLDARVAAILGRTAICMREDLSELERPKFEANPEAFLSQALHLLGRPFMGSTRTGVRGKKDPPDYSAKVRAGLRLLTLADSSPFDGESLFYYVLALESVLLEGDSHANTTARLIEAVSFFLGANHSERAKVRDRMKTLYDHRSGYAHNGNCIPSPDEAGDAREIVIQVLQKELRMLGQSTE